MEIRKIDCISFRITGNTNFTKKLTSFVSRFFPEKSSWKSKLQKFANTAGAGAMREQLRNLLYYDRSVSKQNFFYYKNTQNVP